MKKKKAVSAAKSIEKIISRSDFSGIYDFRIQPNIKIKNELDGEDQMSPIEVLEEKFASLYVSLDSVVNGLVTMRDIHSKWGAIVNIDFFIDELIKEGKRALEVCK